MVLICQFVAQAEWIDGSTSAVVQKNLMLVNQVESGHRLSDNTWSYCMQALVKYLDNVSDEDIPSLEIPTGVPLIYELDENLKPIKHYYVG